jgi:multidrug efflux pump subunit AcrA (membrane-fusion protein)
MKQFLRQAKTVLQILLARLRFVAVFIIAALVVGYWDDIKNHVDKWTRPPIAPDSLAAAAAGTIEFYCPMHPEVIRTEPGKCPRCGMPLVKRKRGEAEKLPADVLARVNLTPRRVALANVQTTPVAYRRLIREIRSLGILDYNETRLARISARVSGRADDLFIQYTGQTVKKGDPVYSLYSPEVYTAQREYLLSRKRVNDMPADAGMDSSRDASAVYNASMQKLVLWGISTEQLDKLDEEYDRTGKIPTNLTVTSPLSGIVVKKEIDQGKYVQMGESPYTVADLSKLWLKLKLYERDVPLVTLGSPVQLVVDALPNEVFNGVVTFKAFLIDPETRTLDARVEVDNADLRLRPGMFANAIIEIPVVPATQPTQPSSQPASPTLSAVEISKIYRRALAPYLQAQKLLSEDKAANVAGLLTQSLKLLEPIQHEPAVHAGYARLADAVKPLSNQPLDALRKSFTEVSAAMIELGKSVGIPADTPGVKVFRCPMVKANWLQEGDQTANPYYGSRMLDCGSAVEALPKVSPAAVPPRPSVAPAGKVLAIPRSAVIDTGMNRIVYVESSPGVFDMRAVKLGPLAGDLFPVFAGLDEGDTVVTIGTFLIDAENRLNPARTESAPVHQH